MLPEIFHCLKQKKTAQFLLKDSQLTRKRFKVPIKKTESANLHVPLYIFFVLEPLLSRLKIFNKAFYEPSLKRNDIKNPYFEKKFQNISFCSDTYKPAKFAALQHLQ